MSVQYQYQTIVEDNVSVSASSLNFPERSEQDLTQSTSRQEFQLPKAVGIVQVFLGSLTAFLGLMEVLVVPLNDNETASVHFNKATCYGAGLYAGLLMVLTGSITLRANMSRRKTSMHHFYNLTMLTMVLYLALTVFIMVAFALGWNNKFPEGSLGPGVHAAVGVLVVAGVMVTLTPLVSTFDHVCCGPGQLWHWWTHCLCEACSTRIRKIEPPESDSSASTEPVALLI